AARSAKPHTESSDPAPQQHDPPHRTATIHRSIGNTTLHHARPATHEPASTIPRASRPSITPSTHTTGVSIVSSFPQQSRGQMGGD
ncbi:hypothetical protein ACLOJK_029201, partial [Asimina triloba]